MQGGVTTVPLDPSKRDEAVKQALDHAWEWFSLHATQRLQSVNFFLVAVAFLSAAFVTAVKEQMYFLAGGIALLGACISLFFYRMERRIRSLVQAAECAMEPLEKELADCVGVDAVRLVSHVEEAKPGEWKYSKVFRYLYFTTAASFILGLWYVVSAAVHSAPGATAFYFAVQATAGLFLTAIGYEMLISPPDTSAMAEARTTTRWALVILGIICVLSGVLALLHLLFFRVSAGGSP
jgi:hypothetical protein